METKIVYIALTLVIFNVDAVVFKGIQHINTDSESIDDTKLTQTNEPSIQNIRKEIQVNPDSHVSNQRIWNDKEEMKNHISSDIFINSEKNQLRKSNNSNIANKSLKEITSYAPSSLEPILENIKSPVVKRTILPGNELEFGGRNGPFCYDRYVTGNCRYRTDPEYCFQYEWTAYAIVQNLGGGIQSEPPGLLVEPGTQERVRVWIKTSCCTPFVRIISANGYNVNACVVDVRELQGLHPGEIAGIVLGVLLILIIIIVVVVLLIRKRNTGVGTVENDCPVKSYGFNMRPGAATSNSQHSSRVK